MTHADITEFQSLQAPPPSLRQSRLVTWIVLVGVAIGLFLGGYSIARLDQIASVEERRADQATASAEQLCEQVRRLGAVCVVDPAELRGETGAQGPPGLPGVDGLPGRPPTQAEITAAVAAYLAANPPSPGAPGQQGDPGVPGMPCPEDGFHLEVRLARLLPGSAPVRGLFCIAD